MSSFSKEPSAADKFAEWLKGPGSDWKPAKLSVLKQFDVYRLRKTVGFERDVLLVSAKPTSQMQALGVTGVFGFVIPLPV